MNPLWISALGTAMMGLSAVVASWAGIRGLDAWRAEVVGRRKAELAEEVLAQFYRIRDVVAWARLPMPLDPVAGETAGEAVDRRNAAARAPVERLAAERLLRTSGEPLPHHGLFRRGARPPVRRGPRRARPNHQRRQRIGAWRRGAGRPRALGADGGVGASRR